MMGRARGFLVVLALLATGPACAASVTRSAPVANTQSVIPRLKGSTLGLSGVYQKTAPMNRRDGAGPSELPAGMLGADEWPTTCSAAARDLLEFIPYEGRERLRKLRRSELIRTHFGLGMLVRNRQGFWRGNTRLIESCSGSRCAHPDTAAMEVILIAWRKAQRMPRR